MPAMSKLLSAKLPEFIWGTATSSFQIEGGIENDMTRWEKLGRFKNNGTDPRIGQATDHWNRWEEDFKLLKDLNVNSYRFSIEWARIEPEPGKFNIEAVNTYSRMIDRLLEYKIVPMLTLHHFSHPEWFHNVCPWYRPESIEFFSRFVEFITPRLLDRVPYIVTFNEPLVWLLAGYGYGKFPPGDRDLSKVMNGLKHMLLAHRKVYDAIMETCPGAQIGIANNFISFKRAPHGWPLDLSVKRKIHQFYNTMIVDAFTSNRLRIGFPLLLNYDQPVALDDKIDFWGVNYYYRLHVKFRFNFRQPFELLSIARSSGQGKSDLGWEIYPKGLKKVCRWLSPTNKPIIITENGIAAENDKARIDFLKSHLEILKQVRQEMPQVKGYFYWSLLDNYEWLYGTSCRFGLYHVDYENGLSRRIKPSGEYFRDYIAQEASKSI
jgi:beta-glucosidase